MCFPRVNHSYSLKSLSSYSYVRSTLDLVSEIDNSCCILGVLSMTFFTALEKIYLCSRTSSAFRY